MMPLAPHPSPPTLPPRAGQPGGVRVTGLGVALAALAMLAGGCSSMSQIDQRVNRLIQDTSGELGGDATPPTTRPPAQANNRIPGETDKQPPTVNPEASELTFIPAEPGTQRVLDRLRSYSAVPSDPLNLSLTAAFTTAQQSAREFLNAEEDYMLAAIRLLIERHLWGPRFFNELTAGVTADGLNNNYTSALRVINELRATQRLPYGGAFEAAVITDATQRLSNEVSGGRLTDATTIALSANIPLLRNAGLIAQEDLIQAERDLIYSARDFENFRRTFFVDLARDYFELIAQLGSIRNQERRLESVMQFQEQTRAKVDAGRIAAFEARRVEQDVLSSQNSLVNAREVYILSLDRFKVRLGIPVQQPVVIEPVVLDLPDPEISVDDAAAMALQFRLDYQNQIDRVADARRAISNAQNQLLPDLDVGLNANIPTDEGRRRGRLRFDPRDSDYAALITFGLPLDREIERLNLRATVIAFQRSERNLDLATDNLILDARRAVREIDRARLSVQLQQETVRINELRLEELRIKQDEVEPRDRLDAETDLLDARNQLQNALRDLRTAILEYLLVTGQMRVAPDGTFLPLQGMVFRMISPDAPGAETGQAPGTEIPGIDAEAADAGGPDAAQPPDPAQPQDPPQPQPDQPPADPQQP